MTESDSQNAPLPRQRSWFAKNWYWCMVPLSIALGWMVFRSSFHAGYHPGYIDEDKHETIQLIERFHARMNASQFGDIYDDAHAGFQNSISRDNLIKAMRATQNQWGQFKHVTFSELNESIGPQIQIRAVYNSSFEKGDATELFTFVRQDDKIQLAFYNIEPGTKKPDTASDAANVAMAQRAAEDFYRRLVVKDYATIWDTAHPDFKKSTSRDQMTQQLEQLDKKLGNCSAPALLDTNYDILNGEQVIGLIYQRKCEHGEIRERFGWKIVDGKALLRGYHH